LEPALLFGGLVVVTGPTVIGPLLRSIALSRPVDALLRWESVWGDCVGVLLAGVMLENALGRYEGVWLPALFVVRLAAGLLVGWVTGFALARWLLPRALRLGDQSLPGILTLASAVCSFLAANALVPHAGVIAAATAGMTVARMAPSGLADVRRFEDQFSTLVIAFLFVLLSAQIDLWSPSLPWGRTLLIAGALAFVVRPAATLIGLLGTPLRWRERVYVGLIGPRGIIAAAVATYCALALHEAELRVTGLRLLVFTTIMVTGGATTLLGGPLARLLRVQLDELGTGIAIVGMDPLARELARVWGDRVPVVLVDSDPIKCAEAAGAVASVIQGDALDEGLYDQLIDAGCRRALVKTANPALNNLIARKAIESLGVNRVFVLAQTGGVDKAIYGLPPRVLGFAARGLDLAAINAAIAWGQASVALDESGDAEGSPQFAVAAAGGGVRLLRATDKPNGPVYCLAGVAARGAASSAPTLASWGSSAP
jgi:hypothetical protein